MGPLESVHVDSEVEELQSVVLHAPGDAHEYILPEHVEAVLSLSDFLYRRSRVESEELDGLSLEGPDGKSVDLLAEGDLRLRYRTKDGAEGTLPLGGALEHWFLENPQYILFDDIVDAEDIRTEYARFEQVVRTVAPHTFNLVSLIHDALHRMSMDSAIQDEFFARLLLFCPAEERVNVPRCRRYFETHGPRAFLRLLVTGRDQRGRYVFSPLPNLLFTRDLAAVVGSLAVICSAAKPARLREMVLSWLVYTVHPMFAGLAAEGKMEVVDMLAARRDHATPDRVTIEGGDILHLGGGTLLVGVGERTTREGAIELARLIWSGGRAARSGIDRIIVLDILARRASMHLDTIFTMVHQDGDEFEAMVYGPYVQEGGFGAISAVVLEPGDFAGGKVPAADTVKPMKRRSLGQLFTEIVGWRMRPLFCGGRMERRARHDESGWADPAEVFFGALPEQRLSKREQWTDGANLFALAPGIVTTYARNRRSLEELSAHNFMVVPPEDFVRNSLYYLKRCRGASGNRVVIPFGGSELSRGRGGQRCMTQPILRARTARTS